MTQPSEIFYRKSRVPDRHAWNDRINQDWLEELVEAADILIRRFQGVRADVQAGQEKQLEELEKRVMNFPLLTHQKLLETLLDHAIDSRKSLKRFSPTSGDYKRLFRDLVWMEFRILNQQKRIKRKIELIAKSST